MSFDINSHDLFLEDEFNRFGLKLDGGVQAVREISQTPSSLQLGGGGKKYGTGDPTFSEITQDDWSGGRGGKIFGDDPTRFFDSRHAVTWIPNVVFPQLVAKYSTGIRSHDIHQPGTVKFIPLTGTTRYYAISFPASASYSADKCAIWLRRRGYPGTGTLELTADNVTPGTPGVVAKTITFTTSTVTDWFSVNIPHDWTTTEALTSATTYWIKVYGASTDTEQNHWEIGVDPDTIAGKKSAAGSTWADATEGKMYFRVTDADVDTKWHQFIMDGTDMYAVSQPPSGNSAIKKWNESTDVWDAVSPTGTFTGIVKSVAVSDNLAYMAMGTGSGDLTVRVLNYTAPSTYAIAATTTYKADLATIANHATAGTQLFLLKNESAAAPTYTLYYGNPHSSTTYTPRGTITLPKGFEFIGLEEHNNQLWMRSKKGLFALEGNKVVNKSSGLGSVIDPATYSPMLSINPYLYFQWSYSLEAMQGSAIDDVGPWHGEGLPDGKQGIVSALCAGIGGIYVGIDGGTANTSSVYWFDNRGFHQVWEAPAAGIRVRNVFYQPQNGTTAPGRLWINAGNDLIYIAMPDQSLNALYDTDSRFRHEFVLTSPTHDFGAMQMQKLYQYLDVISRNLGASASIEVDVQFDENVGLDGAQYWTPITTIAQSPFGRALIRTGESYKARYRVRAYGTSTNPPVMEATVLYGLTRTPIRRQWNLRIKTSDWQRNKRGGKDHKPLSLYNWLIEAARSAKLVYMRSKMMNLDGVPVLVQPPQYNPQSYSSQADKGSAVIVLTLLEAEEREDIGAY